MTSAWKEPPSRDDGAEGPAGPGENQLDMFETAPRGADTLLPPVADLLGSSKRDEGEGRHGADPVNIDVAGRGVADANGGDPDELRRLEDSIRWLMNEGGVRHLPRAATLAPVRGLPPVEADVPDSFLLNPESLFPPRSSYRRSGGVTRGVVKFLLASVIAAPAAYLVANWLQRAGTAAPSDSASVAASFPSRIAAVDPTPRRQPVNGTRDTAEIPGTPRVSGTPQTAHAPQVEPAATRSIPPVEAVPVAAADAKATGGDASEPSPAAPGASPVPAPVPKSGGEVTASLTPLPSAPPPKPAMSPQEIAVMMERGHALFESGDLAAARLFFRRAASAGEAAAAIAMGATYDPDVLSRRFVRGIGADAAEARMWYEKARVLGSPEGTTRIEMLAHR